VLTNAQQVRSLSPEQARQHISARLKGVVVSEAETGGSGLVMLDGSAGIYLTGNLELIQQLHRGDWIEAEGVCDPGEFAPQLLVQKTRVLGKRPIPTPRAASYEQMISGAMDAQWVEVSGVIRRCEARAQGGARFEMATGGGRLSVKADSSPASDVVVDAEVRLRGICFPQVNRSRQLLGAVLYVPRDVPITVERTAPPDPFDTPVCPISGLMRFAPNGNFGHRVHVRGVVTCSQPGKQFWLQDDERGLRVRTAEKEPLAEGEVVDVAGFPIRGDYTPILEDAVFQSAGSEGRANPRKVARLSDALNNDADLVELEAQLTEIRASVEECSLRLSDGGESFKAVLYDRPANWQAPSGWQVGSRLRLRGICAVVSGLDNAPSTGLANPMAFQVLLRSSRDVTVVKPAPRFSWQGLAWALSVALAGLLGVTIWVWVRSRKRIREQSLQRAMAEREMVAILHERNRMAREIHDTLAQGLGAISMRLEIAKDCLAPGAEDARSHLEEAHSLVRNSLADARGAIWNMRAQVLESGDLAQALGDILRQLTAGTRTQASLSVSGQARRLAPLVENDLLRIGQEAVTNAMKHARAREILVSLEFDWNSVRLLVRDDGAGFNAEEPPPSEGGFGLLGIRERVEQLGGEFSLRSQPGQGTELVVRLPAPE
jgi:signal transduction histidine kinase